MKDIVLFVVPGIDPMRGHSYTRPIVGFSCTSLNQRIPPGDTV